MTRVALLTRIVASAAALALAPAALGKSPPPSVVHVGAAEAPIAAAVAVPAGSRLVYVSGTVPDAANPAAPEGSSERFGDTETQTRNILGKIAAILAAQGMGLGDVTMMRVYMVAPPGQSRMDFAGMMRAYKERFGTAAQPNKPARSTMQVAGLVAPGWLLEIDVVAARAESAHTDTGK